MGHAHLGELPVGTPIPPEDKHAITVSFPTWKNTVDYMAGEPSVADIIFSAYPRFFMHGLIRELAAALSSETGNSGERCDLFPTARYAAESKAFILAQSKQTPPPPVQQAQFSIRPEGRSDGPSLDVHAIFFTSPHFQAAEQFWELTGFGMSSRLAQRCLDLMAGDAIISKRTASLAAVAKDDLSSRIAGLVASTDIVAQSAYGLISPRQITKDDVFLYPTGMTALWEANQLVMKLRPGLKSVCFGFPYTDTLKVLQKWGPGCHFLGHDPESDMEELEKLLASSPISALFCELPSNPLLRSPRLDRLRTLADKYDFLIVLDETVGSFANIDVLPYVDILATSLSKYVSGYANVLGGSLVFNPHMRHYNTLKAAHVSTHVNTYYDEDLIVMERNSRDFLPRMRTINANAMALCEFLRSRSLSASPTDKYLVIKEVFYPKWVTRESYDICRRKQYPGGQTADDNFGGLFSLTFVSELASHTFFNALPFAKGPSLGTAFTLVCPYAILAHFRERRWAAEYGVEEGMVRVSVGTESLADLLADFGAALKRAEDAVEGTR